MTENMNFQKGEGDSEKTPEEQAAPQRPKHIFRKNQKNDPSRSKSAPAEDFTDTDESDDYLSSYNYFIYYNSIKPVDPRLPKPTYKPKPNLDYIRESKDKEEEDEYQQETNQKMNINPIENLTKELNQINLDNNTNSPSNKEDLLSKNLLNDNLMNNYPKNQKNKNNFNQTNESPSPFDYYSQSMNVPNQQNDISQQQMWNENLGMNGMGIGIYNPGLGATGGMVGMGMNPMNPLLGMNMGINPYGNLPQFGNMMGMNSSLMNANGRMNAGNAQFNRGRKNQNQKKGNNNRGQEGFDQMAIQNQMFNNLYGNQATNGLFFPQQNPMMNMYNLNDQRFQQMMQMNQGFQRNNLMQGDMNNFDFYQNMNNNANKINNKKNKKGENFVRKEVNEYKNIEEIIEKAVILSKDHSGSRLVQRKYEEGDNDIKNRIFEKFKPEILNLSKDIFGNYAIQKVLESKDKEKNNFIMESLKGKIYELSLHMYGCRVMQQLISVIDEKYLPQITLELKDHFAKCIEDQNGNHVIQKLIERLKPGENNGIYDVVYNNLVDLSKHQYGCRVIQTLLKQCNEQQVEKMLEKIYKDVKELSEDQYGNYIIQYILENQKGNSLDSIYEGLKGNIYDFSIHKYASNVVERALTFGNEAQRQNIINEIIEQDDQMKECLLSMVKDKFGNYVVQKIIEYSDAETRKNIISRIISSQSLKKKDGFSKHVINFIEKLNSGNNGIKLDLTSTSNGGNEDSKNQNTKGVSPDDHHI